MKSILRSYQIGIFGVMIILMSAFALLTANTSTPSARTHYMIGDYPSFNSLKDIVAKSTVVVEGTVKETTRSYRVIPDGVPLDKLPAEKAQSVGFMLTDVVMNVDQVISGPASLKSTAITVIHPGGENGQDKYVSEEEPMSEQGRSYLLFLERTNDGRYVVVGGPQGRYLVQGGKLVTLTDEARSMPLARLLNNMPVDTFKNDFSRLMQVTAPRPPAERVPSTDPESKPANKPSLPGPQD